MSQFDVKMTALADAIKAKNNNITGKLSVQGMIDAVDGIQVGTGGGVDVSGVTATPDDVLAGKTFVNSAGELVDGSIGESLITKSANRVTIHPGYVADTQYIVVGETTLTGVTRITPSTAMQTISRDTYIAGVVQIEGDTNLDSDNIRANSSIFNVAGGFTANATATAADIVAGKTAGINGEMVTGTLEVGGGGESGIEFYKCASYTPSDKKWAGYRAMQDKQTGIWTFASEVTSNLTALYLTPNVGEIYSADTSIRVRKMFDGSAIPIPTEGLVFYSPLQTDYTDLISGSEATRSYGEFTTYKGVKCLHLDGAEGQSYVAWGPRSDMNIEEAVSLIVFAAPIASSGWRVYNLLCQVNPQSTSERIGLYTKENKPIDWGGSLTNGEWQSFIVTRSTEMQCRAYVNGGYVSSGTSNFNAMLAAPLQVFVGGDPTEDYFDGNVEGYIAFAAVYNRELTAEEIAEIHNTLMEYVTQ